MYLLLVPIGFVVVIAGFLLVLAIGARLASRTVEDERFGTLRGGLGEWYGVAMFAQRRVGITLDGGRRGPSPVARALVDRLEAHYHELRPQLARRFAHEVRTEGLPPEDAALARALDVAIAAGDDEALLAYTQLVRVNACYNEENDAYEAVLEYEHAWDPEHTRSLVVGPDLRVVDYGLSCAMVV